MSTLFITSINYREHPQEMEENTLPSQTQPDEVMTIREMLTRHVRGLPVAGSSGQGMYYDEELGYVPSREELDLSEIDDYRQQWQDVVHRLQEQEKEKNTPLPKNPKSAEGDKPQTSDGQESSASDPES